MEAPQNVVPRFTKGNTTPAVFGVPFPVPPSPKPKPNPEPKPPVCGGVE